MTAPMPEILQGDARNLPLRDESVDIVVTSPPYFGLRDYGVDGQLGDEPSPREFLDALIECTAEMVRVLKPSGSIFVNLGDKYSGAGRGNNTGSALTNPEAVRERRLGASNRRQHLGKGIIPAKSLMMLPERYRIAAVDQLGLIARAVIVWSKPNGLPESVTDRVRRSHEDWVHLTKQPRYFASVDEIRETTTNYRGQGKGSPDNRGRDRGNWAESNTTDTRFTANPLGKLPGSVWTIPTQPLKVPPHLGVDHFAAFPMEWPRRIICGWCPAEVCTACREGRRPIAQQVDEAYAAARALVRPTTARDVALRPGGGHSNSARSSDINNGVVKPDYRITGYACACPDLSAPSTPGVVLDPFSGTGTTALVATMLGRRGIGVDLNPDYVRLAEWRASDPKERARAAGLDPDAVAAIRPELPGQANLLDLLDDGTAS